MAHRRSTHRGIFLSETPSDSPTCARSSPTQIYEGRLDRAPRRARFRPPARDGPPPAAAPSTCRALDGVRSRRRLDRPRKSRADRGAVDQPRGVSCPARRRRLHGGRPLQRPGATCARASRRDPRTPGVQSGPSTSSRAGGRVVFFTMTTSSAADMPRGAGFLFSRNRLNVAISRARCLAYLVCTEDLLQPGQVGRRHASDRHPLCLCGTRRDWLMCNYTELVTMPASARIRAPISSTERSSSRGCRSRSSACV